eukprot:364891-Chlamydomonas_euryale.AAC.12
MGNAHSKTSTLMGIDEEWARHNQRSYEASGVRTHPPTRWLPVFKWASGIGLRNSLCSLSHTATRMHFLMWLCFPAGWRSVMPGPCAASLLPQAPPPPPPFLELQRGSLAPASCRPVPLLRTFFRALASKSECSVRKLRCSASAAAKAPTCVGKGKHARGMC